ncbi:MULTISPECIES: homoserine kinase [unclassified Brevibacterium]|uniref:homoserine kinase n=1 Tax=unclassified Brevibacterium TaxID=2614124 RepID=UPI0010820A8D|nr:homoserine kinase [Brevibacterium sp. S111]TGD12057.1 homoserine kinase [Brevibacterium sp. S111]
MRLRLEVPATSANLGPGYDSFGLALNIVDTLTLTVHDAPVDPATCVEVAGEGAEVLPRDRSHLIMRIIGEVLAAEFPGAETGLAERLSLHCINRIPHSRGLGSSAAAVVAGIGLAVELGREYTGIELSRERVLELATAVEGHPDNAAPAIFGGLTVSLSDPVLSWQVPVRTLDEVTVLIPAVRLDTDVARGLIPAAIDHAIAAENSARAGLLVHGLVSDASVLFEATRDQLHQEFRRSAYPESMALVDSLRTQGLPTVISGAGPTVLVLAEAVPESAVPADVIAMRTAIDLEGYRVSREN